MKETLPEIGSIPVVDILLPPATASFPTLTECSNISVLKGIGCNKALYGHFHRLLADLCFNFGESVFLSFKPFLFLDKIELSIPSDFFWYSPALYA